MKIGIVVDTLDPHPGWGRLALTLGDGLRAHDHVVGFLTSRGADSTDVRAVKMRWSGMRDLPPMAHRLLKIRRWARRFDAIICFDLFPYGAMFMLSALGLPVKKILNVIGTYSVPGRRWSLRNAAMRWAIGRADALVVDSGYMRRLIEGRGVSLSGAIEIPVGVDTERFHPVTPTERPCAEPYILSVGALKRRKGYHFSIPAFGLLAKEFPNLRYVIVGSRDNRQYLDLVVDLARQAGVEDRVLFREGISDQTLLSWYGGAEAFVLSSVEENDAVEGFGMVYLEAGACGKPVVGCTETGAEDAIVDGVTGFLVPHDPQAIAAALQKILFDPAGAARMGEAGRARAELFRWDNVVSKYEQLLISLFK